MRMAQLRDSELSENLASSRVSLELYLDGVRCHGLWLVGCMFRVQRMRSFGSNV
jgi:hypothetical protein